MHESEGYMPYTPHGLFICLWAKVEFIEAKCCGLKSLRRRVFQVTLRLLVGTRFDGKFLPRSLGKELANRKRVLKAVRRARDAWKHGG